MIKKLSIAISLLLLFSFTPLKAEELKEIGKFKDWQSMVLVEPTGTVCFAQYSPVLQAPKFNQNNSVTATSEKEKIKFDIVQQGFAWIADNKIEKKMVNVMKKGSRLMITGYNQNGSQTIDHYSLLGFSKAYDAAKTACS